MGLALAFVGIGYLVWAFAILIARGVLGGIPARAEASGAAMHPLTRGLSFTLVEAGTLIDLIGVVWLTLSLALVVLSSRQMISISWAWVSALCQSFVAAIVASLAAWSVNDTLAAAEPVPAPQKLTSLSLSVFMALAVVIWVTFLIWMLVERARLGRRGPTLSDGLRSNVYK